MNGAPGIERGRRHAAGRTAWLGLLALLLLSGLAAAGQTADQAGEVAVAKCTSVAGVLLEREPGKAWLPLKAGGAIRGDTLLVAMPKAEILSRNGAVALGMLSDLGQRGPLPVLESGVVLHANSAADLDLTFERGLISVTNVKKEGSAKVRIRLPGDTWDLTLREPGTKALLEIYGRHPPGAPQTVQGKVEPPASEVYLLLVKGRAFLDVGPKGFGLSAPPGQARVHWDSVAREVAIQRLEKLPEGVRPLDDKESKIFQEICECAGCLTAVKDLGPALDELLKSNQKLDRLLGVTVAGAVDDLPHVLTALSDPKHPKLRDHTVLVLRNWLGRGPGQVEKLHAALRQAKYNEVQAKTVLRLLFGFDAEERAAPATYDLLINYLNHSKLPVRELARWHLFRLAPAGRDIPYDAAAPAAERRRAYEAWRALVPEGKLPPAPKTPAPK
jgi:hypothetical protein